MALMKKSDALDWAEKEYRKAYDRLLEATVAPWQQRQDMANLHEQVNIRHRWLLAIRKRVRSKGKA